MFPIPVRSLSALLPSGLEVIELRKTNKKPDREKILIFLLGLITLIAVCVTIWALFFRNPAPVLAPDYAPQKEEENAEPIGGDSEEKLEAEEGGGAVSLTYSDEVSISLSGRTATLYFANPGKSTQDMVVQVVIQDEVIIQSGTLKPGNQVTALALLDGAEKKLAAGGYDGKFVVLYYDPDTGEKAAVNTEIPIAVTVSE